MALELDWTDAATDVTYNNAYAVISHLTYTKGVSNNYGINAEIRVYKDATAFAAGKKSIAKTIFTSSVTIQSSDTAQTYRNVVNQIYNEMKQNDPWDDATDV